MSLPTRRTAFLSVLIGASLIGGVALGSSVVPVSPSEPEWFDEEAPAELRVLPGTRSIERQVPDPRGGLGWGLQVGTSTTGRTCVFVGRIRDEEVGRVTPQGRFLPRRDALTDSCGQLGSSSRDAALVLASSEDGVLLIHGAAGPAVASVSIGGEELPLSPKRSYLAARIGTSDDLPRYPVSVGLRDGTTVVYPWDGPPREL